MIDLNGLSVFVRVAEAGSFSSAAKSLGMPISTVSRRVAEVEAALGARLLERSTRRLRLTDIGGEILGHCRRGLEAFEEAQLTVSNRQADVRGTLRVSAPPSLAETLLAPLAGGFRSNYPNVRIDFLVTERKADLIAEGIDVALRVGGGHRDSGLIAKPILRYRHLLVASPNYVVRHGEPSSPDMLSHHRLAAFASWGLEPVWTLSRDGETRTITPSPVMTANDYLLLVQAALHQETIADMPAIACIGHLRGGTLVEIMKPWVFPTIALSAIHLGRRNMSRVVRLFIDFCSTQAPILFRDLPR